MLQLLLVEIAAQVEQRLGEQAPMFQKYGDQQASHTAVAIEKRVDRF